MEHRYIDDHSVTERYLGHALSPSERVEFEAHLVDCQECADRVLLAEMFHSRNGKLKAAPLEAPEPEDEALRVRFVRQFTPWQLFLIFVMATALLVLGMFSLLLWLMRR